MIPGRLEEWVLNFLTLGAIKQSNGTSRIFWRSFPGNLRPRRNLPYPWFKQKKESEKERKKERKTDRKKEIKKDRRKKSDQMTTSVHGHQRINDVTS